MISLIRVRDRGGKPGVCNRAKRKLRPRRRGPERRRRARTRRTVTKQVRRSSKQLRRRSEDLQQRARPEGERPKKENHELGLDDDHHGHAIEWQRDLRRSKPDTLQFIANEEGRTRWAYRKYTNGTTGYV